MPHCLQCKRKAPRLPEGLILRLGGYGKLSEDSCWNLLFFILSFERLWPAALCLTQPLASGFPKKVLGCIFFLNTEQFSVLRTQSRFALRGHGQEDTL